MYINEKLKLFDKETIYLLDTVNSNKACILKKYLGILETYLMKYI